VKRDSPKSSKGLGVVKVTSRKHRGGRNEKKHSVEGKERSGETITWSGHQGFGGPGRLRGKKSERGGGGGGKSIV